MTESRIEFGPFLFDPDKLVLTREGTSIGLGTRGATLLKTLLESEGNVVSKQELLDAAWPDTVVEESNLAVQIATLRKTLGTQQTGKHWIDTVPRLGYRLLLPAGGIGEEGNHRRPAVAVLPFDNLGEDDSQAYVGDGIVEDITTALSRFKTFAVMSRSSAYAYKGRTVDVRQVGKELGVRYVLEGAIRSAGEQIRVNAQLVETESGIQVWGDRFDGPREAFFEAQDKITDGVVRAIQPNIARAEVKRALLKRTSNPTAYELYLRALPKLYFREGTRVTDLLEEALRIDPGFAAAAAFAGSQYLTSYFHQVPGSSEKDLERGRALLQQVLPVCGDDSLLLANCALMHMQLAEYDQAVDLATRSVSENPNDSIALGYAGAVHLFAGELGTANDFALRALALNPNEFWAHGTLTCLSHIRMAEEQFEDALVWAKRSLAVSAHYTPTYWMLIAGNALLKRQDEAEHYLNELTRIAPELSISKLRNGQHAREPQRVEILFEGMRLAGLPDS